MTAAPKRVLFVCVENSNRSQMAEAFARMHGGERVDAYSAGSNPSGRVNPKAIRSKALADLPRVEFDAAVTMGCGDACPMVDARRRVDWEIPDPRDMDEGGVR